MTRNAFAACLKILFVLLTAAFIILPEKSQAQEITEIPDLPIDPNALKNAAPGELQGLLQDFNRQNAKPGEDLHRRDIKSLVTTDSTRRDQIRKSIADPRAVYGIDIFHNSQILQLSELSTPPDDYKIGAGDHVVVSLWGGADFEEEYIVARDGSIFPRGLGKIAVQGLTFVNARAVIYDRFKKVIPDGTNIAITMGQPRSIVVQVSGNVQNPGPVVVSAFTNAMNVVALAGGATDYGNLRNILLERNGKVIDSIDIYQYLNTGGYGKHLYLENNDFIIVPFYEKKVLATGQFRRPMYYQLKKGEGVRDLIRYAGGFTSDAYASAGTIIRNENEKQTIKTVNMKTIGLHVNGEVVDEPLYDGDIVAINIINPGLKNKVIVKGEVAYPNVYEVRPGDRLFDLINRAGGVTPNTYLDRAYVYKGAGDSTSIRSDKIDVNLKDFNIDINSANNIPIGANDIIEVFNRNQFGERQMISIEGEVRKPGTYQKYGSMTLKDLLYFANGLLPSAEFGMITVSSVVDTDSSQNGFTPTRTITKTYSINKNLSLDSVTEKVILKPYDQVFVRRNPEFHLQQNVKINGEVKYPGTYPKLEPDEKITSFIERAGGLKSNSNLKGAFLYRLKDSVTNKMNPFDKERYTLDSLGNRIYPSVSKATEPVAINLEEAIKNPNSKYNLELKEGDIVYIPAVNPVVSVTGTVQNELKVFFDKEHSSVRYYIDKAGGFKLKPWRKRIFVTYANGTSRRTRNFGFLHFYPKVESGSVINVPQRPEGKSVVNIASQTLVSSIPLLIAFVITRLK